MLTYAWDGLPLARPHGFPLRIVEPDKTVMIPIGGIAHEGARGVSRVEVSVDGGPWERALFRDPMSPTTWVIWRYDWPFRPGKHTFTVRCFEGDGTPQIVAESPISPSGATGLDSVTRML